MRKIITICFGAILVLALLAGWNLMKNRQAKQDISMIDRIGEVACAKFEYSDSKDNGILITSEIKTLSNIFLSLDLVESDKTVSDWIYRITFNCKELMTDGQEIVVLIGDDAMSINGETYCTREGVSFEKVIEIFASKYKYFVSE